MGQHDDVKRAYCMLMRREVKKEKFYDCQKYITWVKREGKSFTREVRKGNKFKEG